MALDRSLWAETFKKDLPHWRCPTCNKGHLTTLKDKFWIEETGPSKTAHKHDDWDPDWTTNRFTGFLQCSLPACAELCTVSGSSGIEHWQTGWDEYVHNNIFSVEAINPAPILISYPEDTPYPIVECIKLGSSLIWQSPESAANQIRQSVESLMDDCGIASTNAAGKRIMLHSRIEEFSKTDSENGNVLLATKWLGNSGSHVEGISRDSALDAFDMIEHVLENRYGTTKADLMAKVAAVNKAKGPVTKP